VQTAESSLKKKITMGGATLEKLQFLELRLADLYNFIISNSHFDAKMSMDLDTPIYMAQQEAIAATWVLIAFFSPPKALFRRIFRQSSDANICLV
jgi:hypothetical protein